MIVTRVRQYTVLQIAVSFVFWVWAIINSISDPIDLGAVTFFTVICAGVAGQISLRTNSDQSARTSSTVHMILTPLSHMLVCANYLLSVLVQDFKSKTRTGYRWIAAIAWFLTGVVFSYIAIQWRNRVKENGVNAARYDLM